MLHDAPAPQLEAKADIDHPLRYLAHMTDFEILPFSMEHKQSVIDLTVDAWTPVFAQTQNDVPRFVMDAFYPDGWQVRQTTEVRELLESEPESIWLALEGRDVVGFIGLRLHPEDQMGEIHIVAVAPEHQKRGIATKLMQFAESRIRAAGMKMIMVETIGDSGHAPARRAYEAFGFERWPVARYFKKL